MLNKTLILTILCGHLLLRSQINIYRVAARVSWPPISWVDWQPHVSQLAAGVIMFMTCEQPRIQ